MLFSSAIILDMKRKFFQWRIADWFRLTAVYSIICSQLGGAIQESVVTAAEVVTMWSK